MNAKTYEVYTARFENGKTFTRTSKEFENRLALYNYICLNRIGKTWGDLVEITVEARHE